MVFIRGPCLAHTFESAAAQDEDETWAMTYQKKKELFGSGNRVKVGGEKPEGDSETKSFFVAINLWHPIPLFQASESGIDNFVSCFNKLGSSDIVLKSHQRIWKLSQKNWNNHPGFSNQGCFDQHVPSHFLRHQALGHRCGTGGVSRLAVGGGVLDSIWLIIKKPSKYHNDDKIIKINNLRMANERNHTER